MHLGWVGDDHRLLLVPDGQVVARPEVVHVRDAGAVLPLERVDNTNRLFGLWYYTSTTYRKGVGGLSFEVDVVDPVAVVVVFGNDDAPNEDPHRRVLVVFPMLSVDGLEDVKHGVRPQHFV